MWVFDNNKMQLELIVNPEIRDIYIDNRRRKGQNKGTFGSKGSFKVVTTPK